LSHLCHTFVTPCHTLSLSILAFCHRQIPGTKVLYFGLMLDAVLRMHGVINTQVLCIILRKLLKNDHWSRREWSIDRPNISCPMTHILFLVRESELNYFDNEAWVVLSESTSAMMAFMCCHNDEYDKNRHKQNLCEYKLMIFVAQSNYNNVNSSLHG